MQTLEHAKAEAARLVAFSVAHNMPCAFEVVRLARKTVDGEIFNVQPFGMCALFKSHKLMHVEPVPKAARQ